MPAFGAGVLPPFSLQGYLLQQPIRQRICALGRPFHGAVTGEKGPLVFFLFFLSTFLRLFFLGLRGAFGFFDFQFASE